MVDETGQIVIDQNDLIAKLNELDSQSDGDLARIIELLLLENHVLALDKSKGFRRGIQFEFSQYPRFLEFKSEIMEKVSSD